MGSVPYCWPIILSRNEVPGFIKAEEVMLMPVGERGEVGFAILKYAGEGRFPWESDNEVTHCVFRESHTFPH